MNKKERDLRVAITELTEKGDTLMNIAVNKRTEQQQAEFVELTAQIKSLTTELDSVVALNGAKARTHLQATPVVSTSQWDSAGEFFMAVRNARTTGRIDERLVNAATGNSTTVDADGGYAVDQDFLPKLNEVILQKSLFYSDANKITISANSNKVSIPLGKRGYTTKNDAGTGDISAVYGGVVASWTDEAGQIALSKAKISNLELSLKKVTAMVAITDELMSDSTAMTSYIQQAAPAAIATVLDLAVLEGSGTGQPVGIFDASNKNIVAVKPKDDNKAITLDDINKMYSSLLPSLRQGAKWYINPEMEGLLANMTDDGGNIVYMPAGMVDGKPFAILKGLPVEVSEFMKPTGTKGDILLANMAEYQVIEKGGLDMATSIHVYFDTAQTAFRFIMRCNGSPLYKDKYTSHGDKFELASFVTLDERTLGASGATKSAGRSAVKDSELK
ncbi:MAG: phage major capsid protein [Firmicutes bacterium]|nr:phage major capsid protein [Bacillota bacterium]